MVGTRKTSPIFLKTYDLLLWLLNRTGSFPANHRPALGRRIQETAFALYEALVDASKQPATLDYLIVADAALAKLRTYVRMSLDLKLISVKQYEHACGLMVEVGRLLGGWQRTVT